MNLKKSEDCSSFVVMSNKMVPEMGFLLQEIQRKYGKRIATSTDFESLSNHILEVTKESISSSTLKRLWGYVTLCPSPRACTLDILSRYLGFKDFNAFRIDITKRGILESNFFETNCISVADLKEGDCVTIGWAPDRLVTLRYQGNFSFLVESSQNSKLEPGDRFEMSTLMIGYPLFISRILRNGEYTQSFIAGKETGINTLKVN